MLSHLNIVAKKNNTLGHRGNIRKQFNEKFYFLIILFSFNFLKFNKSAHYLVLNIQFSKLQMCTVLPGVYLM